MLREKGIPLLDSILTVKVIADMSPYILYVVIVEIEYGQHLTAILFALSKSACFFEIVRHGVYQVEEIYGHVSGKILVYIIDFKIVRCLEPQADDFSLGGGKTVKSIFIS